MTLLLILYDLVINYMTFVGHQGGIWSVKKPEIHKCFLADLQQRQNGK